MLGDLFSKLQEARDKIEKAKGKLDDIIVESSAENGAIRVMANANKAIVSIEISEDLLKPGNKQQLEESLAFAVNSALEEAAQKGEVEMKKITRDMLPNFPGLI
jgi:DNA-binding YbaB/EbfC family protein